MPHVSPKATRRAWRQSRRLLGTFAGTLILVVLFAPSPASQTGGDNYLIVYKQHAVPANARLAVENAGGTLVSQFDQIGVAVARSGATLFRDNLLLDSRVDAVSSTANFAVPLRTDAGIDSDASGPPEGDLPNAPASDADTLSPLQWDMRQIKTPQAHAVTGGSPLVVAGDIDTGIDYLHPDLKMNVDFSRSVSCETGAPNQSPAAWRDHNGHGTHTAGTIAAAANGFGIVGVAPNVKLAAIKAGNDAGFFFPEAVVCAFYWAATHQIDVVNNSYFADPFLYNCRNDPAQHAIWKAEQRAILFAEQNGVTVVAAEGNESDDTAHPTMDVTSPDFPPGIEQERSIHNNCVIIPVEIPGVIGVSGVGNARQTGSDGQPDGYLKSFYSSFGVGVTQLTAPGGDSLFGRTPEAPNGRVLSTWPPNIPCARSVKESSADPNEPTVVYCYQQGTSMASPHVAGVAALIISRFGNLKNPQNGKMRPDQVKAYLDQTADPQPCPATLPPGYITFTGVNSGAVQSCQGGPGYNSWYGNGQVDAFTAVTHTAGNR